MRALQFFCQDQRLDVIDVRSLVRFVERRDGSALDGWMLCADLEATFDDVYDDAIVAFDIALDDTTYQIFIST